MNKRKKNARCVYKHPKMSPEKFNIQLMAHILSGGLRCQVYSLKSLTPILLTHKTSM